MKRPAHWPGGGIQTVIEHQRARRALDRRRRATERVLRAMQNNGMTLNSCFQSGRTIWRLSNGEFIADDAARLAIAHPNVAGVGDALFAGATNQTYRWIDNPAADRHRTQKGGRYHG